jgi:hypothetical protein
MASTDEWLTDQPELLTTPEDGDLLHVVDISDTSPSPDGRSKKIQYALLKSSINDGWINFSDDFSNSVVGSNTLVVIADAPVLATIAYDASASILTIGNNNTFGSGIDLTVNYGINDLSSLSTLTHSYTTSSPTLVIPAAAGSALGPPFLDEINDSEPAIITINEGSTPEKTYVFYITLFRCAAGVIISGRYRLADLS